MSKLQQKGLNFTHNGDEIIGFTKSKDLGALLPGYADLTTLKSWYDQNPNENHLKMQKMWQHQYQQVNPIFQELLEKKSILEVDGFYGSFTYDVPIYHKHDIKTEGDTSDQLYPGIDGTPFKIILNELFTKGDVLTADPWYGTHQIVVDTDEDVRQVGTGYEHWVKLTSLNSRDSYPNYLLKPGVVYTKINHSFSEYGTKFSTFQLPKKSTEIQTARFTLGGPRGVEGYVTGFADIKRKGANALRAQLDEILQEEQNCGGDVVLMSNFTGNENAPFDKKTMRVGSIVEYLVHKELDKLTAKSLIWQKAGVIRDTNGETRLNEGLWHQLRRGKIIQYGRPGGITKQQIKEAVDYVFQANRMPVQDRRVTFKCGRGAYDNVMQLFQDEVLVQLGRLGQTHLLGTDRILPKSPVYGNDLNSLGLDLVRFTEVNIPGIGKVNIEHDPSLDYTPEADPQSTGMHYQGYSHSTYSMVIWDVTDQRVTNNMTGINVGKEVQLAEGGNSNSNIFLVKPEGPMNFWGQNNGRWDSAKSYIQQGGLKTLAQEFFAYNSSAIWVRDVTKMVMIELAPSARAGYNLFAK